MFTLDPIHPVYSAVVETVAVRPQISIAELHEHLTSKAGITISLAQLYRVVSRMADAQIVVKIDGKLSLNLMWISYLEFIAGRARRITQHRMDDFPLKPGEKKTYRAGTLYDVEAVWNHVLISLYRAHQEEKMLFKYYSHAWWQLGRNAEEMTFYARLKAAGIGCHWIFGDDTPMDRTGAARIGEVYPALCLADAPFPHSGYNLNVFGEYVVECILPEKIARQFDFFFNTVKTMKEFDNDMFSDIFSMRGPYKITVWRNAKQADLLRRKLTALFKA